MSPSRTRTRSHADILPIVFKLILSVVLAAIVFYVAWLGATYARSFLPAATVATPASSAAGVSSANTGGNSTTNADATPGSSSGSSTASSTNSTSAFNTNPIFSEGSTVTIDGNVIHVAVSTTTAAIDQGLQNQPSLADSQGMLFIFDHTAIFRFWMPNMNFPLDMIWIGSNMQVVDITKDAPPLPDPTNPVWFSPKVPAEYVLEVEAGYADEHNIQDGDPVTFSLVGS